LITVEWDNAEKTAIRLDYFDPVASWGEYQQAVKNSYELARSQSHSVHFIHNAGDAKMPNGNAIGEIRRAASTLPANAGSVCMVISNDFARRVMQVVGRLMIRQVKNFFFVSSVEEARSVIAIQEVKLREKIPMN
jgi:hypothetical protein